MTKPDVPVSVYEIVNQLNGFRYIGIAKQPKKRWTAHKYDTSRGSKTHLHNAIRKYGPDVFEMTVRMVVADATAAKKAEQDLIAAEHPEYNMTAGGDGGWGMTHGPETRAKIGAASTGRTKSPEVRAKMSAAKKGQPSHNKGKKLSEVTKARISASETGKIISAETRLKISAGHQRRRLAKQAMQQEENRCSVYDIGDPDLMAAYDPKAVASKARTPKFPKAAGNYQHNLLRVYKDRTPQAGNQYVFRFQCTKSSQELVLEGATYTQTFYPGKSDVDFNKFWGKITPILMAVTGQNDIGKFNAAEQLGELLSICKDETVVLNLPYGHTVRLEDARPDKDTGKIKAEFLEKDGVTPVKFAMHDYAPLAAATN